MNINEAIKTQMQKAYWNLIKDDLESDDQHFDHVIKLILEIKVRLQQLTPNNHKLKAEIDEKMDSTFLRQLFTQKYDISGLVLFIISKLEKYCAPSDDKEIHDFKQEVLNYFTLDTIVYHEFLEFFIPRVHANIDKIYKRIDDYKNNIIQF